MEVQVNEIGNFHFTVRPAQIFNMKSSSKLQIKFWCFCSVHRSKVKYCSEKIELNTISCSDHSYIFPIFVMQVFARK